MSQMTAMKMCLVPNYEEDSYHKNWITMRSHTVAFPLFLQHITSEILQYFKKFYVLNLFLFHRESGTLFGPVFWRMTHNFAKRYISG